MQGKKMLLRRWFVIVGFAAVVCWALAAGGQGPNTAAPLAAKAGDDSQDREPKGPDPSLPDSGAKKTHAPIKPLTPEEERETLAYAKDNRPEYYEWLSQYRESDPRRYQYLARALWNVIDKGKQLPPEVRQAQEKLYEASQVKLWRLAREILKTTDPAAKARLEGDLQTLMTKRFDAEQVIRNDRLKQLADEIKRLRAELEDRAKNRETIIRERVERMKKDAARRSSAHPAKRDEKESPATRPSRDRK